MAESEEKISFSKRINHALDLYGIPPKGKGRQVTVGKMFGVSQKAANKWLEGMSLPDTMRIAVIAEKLNVNVEWLTYGTGPINIAPIPLKGSVGSRWKRVPLISWEEAGNYELYTVNIQTTWTWCEAECGPKSFALTVKDESMMPRYEPGAIIIVDPERSPQHKDIVVYKAIEDNYISCAQYLIVDDSICLKPHNNLFSQINLQKQKDNIKICGTARQIFMTF